MRNFAVAYSRPQDPTLGAARAAAAAAAPRPKI